MDERIRLVSTPKIQGKPYCFGRDDILKRISEMFDSGENAIALYGTGGMGKTEIVKHYIKRNGSKYDTVIFATFGKSLSDLILSESFFRFDSDFPRKVMAGGVREDDISFFRRKLEAIKNSTDERTLIVIDNMDTYDKDLKELWGGNYRLLVTTRIDLSKDIVQLKIDSIGSDESLKDLFMHNYRGYYVSREDPDLVKMFDMVNRHTYTVELLAQHMGKSDRTVKQMIEELEKHGVKSLDTAVDADSSEVAYKNLSKIFNMVKLKPEELEILKLLSLTPLTGIPAALFLKLSGLKSTVLIQELEQRCWIRRCDNDGIALHTVIRDIVRDKLKPTVENTKYFIDNFTDVIEDRKMWHTKIEDKERYASIGSELVSFFKEINEETWILYRYVEALFSFAIKPQKAIDLAIRIYEYSVEHNGMYCYESAKAAFKIGWAYLFNLQWADVLSKAKEWLEISYGIFKKLELKTVTENATYTHMLVNLSRVKVFIGEEQGDFKELRSAKWYVNKAIGINAKWIKEGDLLYPRIAGGYMQKADVCISLGEYEQALKLLDESYEMLYGIYKDVDPETLEATSQKAIALYHMGRYSEAVAVGLENIAGYDKFYGKFYFGRYEQLLIVLRSYISLGKVAEAKELQKEVLEIGEKIFVKKETALNVFDDIITPEEDKEALLKKSEEQNEGDIRTLVNLINKVDKKLDNVGKELKDAKDRDISAYKKIDSIDERLKNLDKLMRSVYGVVCDKKGKLPDFTAMKPQEAEEGRSAFINETAKEIAKLIRKDSAKVELEEAQLKGLFGEYWNMLDGYTKRALVSANVFAANFRDEAYKDLDFSGVVIAATSALENEIKKRFFVGYQKFLTKKYGKPSEEKWPKSMIYINSEGTVLRNNRFTLGSLGYIFKCNENEAEFLEKYLKTVVCDSDTDSAIGLLYSKADKNCIVARCEKIKNKYRNKAAHSDSVSMKLAKSCISDVIGLKDASEHIGKVQGLLLDIVKITCKYKNQR